MNNSILFFLAIGMLLSSKTIAMAGVNPGSGIMGTSHDLSAGTGHGHTYGDTAEQSDKDRICIYCHAPHHTQTTHDSMIYTPLWNHAATLITTFAMYSNGAAPIESEKQRAKPMEIGAQPGAVSLLCLGCHDGSIAVSEYGLNPSSSLGNATGTKASDRILIGAGAGDLRNHHPIGVYYNDAASRNSELNPSDTPVLGGNKYGLTIDDLLWNGRIECTTCHDVHNTKSESTKFTWVEDRHSNLCFTCHKK